MPYYDYKCASCGHCFELKQSYSDEPLAACPQCQAKARRLLSAAPIIFKGSGFYVTDNRKTSDGDGATKKTKSDNGSATTDTAKAAETAKPEASKADASKPEASKTETAKSETSKTRDKSGVASKTS